MSLSNIVKAAGSLLQAALEVFAALGEVTQNNKPSYAVVPVEE